VAENLKSIEQDKTQSDETEAYIMSIFHRYAEKANVADVKVSSTAIIKSPPSALKAIIKRAKNIQTVDGHPPALQASSVSTKRRRESEALQPANRTWDPGVTTTPRNKLFKINTSVYIYSLVATIMASNGDAEQLTTTLCPSRGWGKSQRHTEDLS
jgi:hypothetical protein